MGTLFEAVCRDCSHAFKACGGRGGFVFHELLCDTCGQVRSILFSDVGEPEFAYLKWMGLKWKELREGTTQEEYDREVLKGYAGPPMNEHKYRRAVEGVVGKCACGGQFRFDAPVRCPLCRSQKIEKGKTFLRYD